MARPCGEYGEADFVCDNCHALFCSESTEWESGEDCPDCQLGKLTWMAICMSCGFSEQDHNEEEEEVHNDKD